MAGVITRFELPRPALKRFKPAADERCSARSAGRRDYQDCCFAQLVGGL
jgi:hypothetical protein